MQDGDRYPPEALSAAYLNHVHRTGMRSESWTLWRGDRLLGSFVSASLPWTDMFWQGFTFTPTAAFEEIRPLFDLELKLLNEEWEINDRGKEHAEVWEQIDQLGLTLHGEHGWVVTEFMLHVSADNDAWFRI